MGEASQTAKIGTEQITKFLRNQKSTIDILNVENDLSYQKKDIDLLWIHRTNVGEVTTSIEIKVDNYYRTGNYFFETLSNVEKNTDGCFMYSEAKYLYYYFLNVELHIFKLDEARKWFIQNKNRFTYKRTSTPIPNTNSVYHTEGALVNRQLFANESGCKIHCFKYTNGEFKRYNR